jgi:hypothetical protein
VALLGTLKTYGSLNPFGSLGQVAPPAHQPVSLREAIYHLLSRDAGIRALVDDRVYPAALPQMASYRLPAVTTVVSGTHEPATLAGSTETRKTTVRVSCWAHSPEDADRLATAVRSCLVNFRGLVGLVWLGRVACDNEIDLPEKPSGGGDQWTHQIVLQMRFWHRSI